MRKLKQETPTDRWLFCLETLSFLWMPLLLISALHLFTKCIPVPDYRLLLLTSIRAQTIFKTRTVRKAAHGHLMNHSMLSSSLWSQDYVTFLLWRGKSQPVPEQQVREAMKIGFISAGVWHTGRTHQLCTATVSVDVSQTSRWFLPSGCAAHPATVHGICQETERSPLLPPTVRSLWQKFTFIMVFLFLPPSLIIHKLVVSISFFTG